MSKPTQLSPIEAFEAIQALLKECGPRLGKPQHVRDRMVERNVNDDDILKVLRTGTVSPAEWNDKHQNWRYPVSGLRAPRHRDHLFHAIVITHSTAS